MGEWIWLAAIGLASATLAALVLSTHRISRGPMFDLLRGQARHGPVYLFDGATLIAESETGPVAAETPVPDWNSLRRSIADDYPGFPDSPDQVKRLGEITVPRIDGRPGHDLHCEWIDGVIRVEQRRPGRSGGTPDPAAEDPIRQAMDRAPYPVWFVDAKDRVRWCNGAYRTLARKLRGTETDLGAPLFAPGREATPGERRTRVSVSTADGGNRLWYDLSVVPQDGGTLCFAVDINAVVDAEIAQRNFVQTLAKTFAQLSIGLAIFDRNRQLALFNPALVDLTALPADFLSGRPSVSAFFDRLRNLNMMPEPKNYVGWRQQMNDLLQAAVDGRYQETWTLPSGSVYSVSGRPHPDGAVAFLFEDITAEITLTRRFRSELEMGQSILDRIEDAAAAFSADGTLAFCNRAYRRLWQVDPDSSFAKVTVLDATRIWQKNCAATPVWGEIRDFIELRENRAEWTATVRLRGGAGLTCIVSPIQNGATLVRFSAGTPATLPSADATTPA